MALADPQTITINAVNTSVYRTVDDGLASEYTSDDRKLKFKVSHTESKTRYRRMARLDQNAIVEDPLTGLNVQASQACYLVIDHPVTGFSNTEVDYLVQALKAWATTANVLKMLGNQH